MTDGIRRILCSAVCVPLAIIPSVTSHAQDTTNAPALPPPPVRDYSKGFEMSLQMGLPDVAGAEYVHLRTDPPHEVYTLLQGLRDRAWLLRSGQHGRSVFLPLGSDDEVVVHDIDIVTAERNAKRVSTREQHPVPPAGTGERNRIFGRWVPADPRIDAQALAKHLAEQTDRGDPRLDKYSRPTYVTAAVQFYRFGLKTEANTIFHHLRRLATDKELAESVVGPIAVRDYRAALTNFQQTGDWGTLVTNMESMVSRFGSVLPEGVMAQRLVNQAKTRAARGPPPPLAGPGLTDLDRALAAAMLTDTQSGNTLPGISLWTLPTEESGAKTNVPRTAIERIVARGMESVPLLLALTNDAYLTPIMPSCFGYGGVADFVVWHGLYQSGQTFDLRNEKKDVFLTRGQIAAVLLRGLVLPLEPGTSGNSSSMSYDVNGDFLYGSVNEPEWQSVEKWYAECRGKTSTELAQIYLRKGATDQERTAFHWLLANASETELRRVEERLRDPKFTSGNMSFVREYVDRRGPKARPFVEEYISFLTNRYARASKDDSDRAWALSSSWHEELRDMTVTVEELATLVAAGKSHNYYLEKKFKSLPFERRLALALESVVAATNRSDQIVIMGLVFDRYTDPRQIAAGSVPGDPMKHAAAWRTLLADQRRELTYGVESDRTTLADVAAQLMDRCYGATCRGDCPTSADHRIHELRLQRARARLEGVPEERLPPLPCSENVPLTRRLQLATEIKGTAATNVLARVTSLGLEDSLALREEMEWDAELTRRLVPVLAQITRVDVAIADTNVSSIVNGFMGKTLGREMMDAALAIGKRTMATNGQVVIVFEREACFDGTRVMAFEGFPEERRWDWVLCGGGRHTEKAYCTVVYSWWGEFETLLWPAKDETAEDARLHSLADGIPSGPDPDHGRDLLNGRIVVMAFPAVPNTQSRQPRGPKRSNVSTDEDRL